ncbi:MAG TPA: DUF2382 domain-containing protein [Longimicrobium sp.]|nr:DUF2382 domain-containing protein [Longimicrobium sp.]
MANNDLDRVVPLNQLSDFKVAEGDPDVRGWEVQSADGRKIGSIDELLIDTNAMKVRYLDVEVDRGMVAGGDDRHVLIPIGYARLERDGDRVIVDNLSASDLGTLPAYDHTPLTRDYETSVRDSFAARPTGTTGALGATGSLGTTGTTGTTGRTADDFYGHEGFDDNRFYGARRDLTGNEERLTLSEEQLAVGKRQVETGEVGVHKTVETQHVRESVPTTREEVTVERHAITDPLRADARITEEEIRVPLHAEEVVAEKRVVPKEELVVRKQEVVENRTVEADLRRERAEVTEAGERTTDRMNAGSTGLESGAGGLGNTDPDLRGGTLDDDPSRKRGI